MGKGRENGGGMKRKGREWRGTEKEREKGRKERGRETSVYRKILRMPCKTS